MDFQSESSKKTEVPRWELALRILILALVGFIVVRTIWKQIEQVRVVQQGNSLQCNTASAGYHEVARIPTGCRQSRGLAIDRDGTLYVAGDSCINAFTTQGKRLTSITLDDQPNCLAVAPDALFVGMRNVIEVRTRQGALTARWAAFGPRAYFTSLAATKDGLWAADAGDRKIVLLNSLTGTIIDTIGVKDEAHGVPGLLVPSPHLDVAIDNDGLIWANDPGRHRVERYTADNRLKSYWGEPSAEVAGFSGCCNPTDIALLPDGRIATSEKGTPRVKIFRRDGVYIGTVACENDFQPGDVGLDLAVDPQGRIYVLDPLANAVRIYQQVKRVAR